MRKTQIVNDWRISALGSAMLVAATLGMAPAAATAQAVTAAAPASPPVSSAAANGVGSAFELTFWQSLAGSDDPAAYDAYLTQYPGGTFSGLARAKIAALQRALTMQPAATPAHVPMSTPVAAPVPAPVPAVSAVSPTLEAAPRLASTPAVVIASAPGAAPVPAAAPPQIAEMIPASASVAAAATTSPLAKLLAQLRGSSDPAAGQAAAPMVTAAQPVQPVSAAGPALAAPVIAALAPTPAAATTYATTYASARPVMLPVPDVTLPAYFCSNDARNAFHNGAYRPAVETATRNNEAAVTYLRQLQLTYDRGQLGRDTAVLNAIALEARAYQGEAAHAYTAQAALVRQFDVLMAVPLRTCASGTQ